MRRNRNVHLGDGLRFRISRRFLVGLVIWLCFCRGLLIRKLVAVSRQKIPQGFEIFSGDVSVPVDNIVANLVPAAGHSHVAGGGAQFLGDGLGQRLAVGRVRRNGHEKNLLCVFCMPLLTLNARKVNGLWAHNANNHSSHGIHWCQKCPRVAVLL